MHAGFQHRDRSKVQVADLQVFRTTREYFKHCLVTFQVVPALINVGKLHSFADDNVA